MKFSINNLNDEQFRYDKLREWYYFLYRANNSVVILHKGEGADIHKLEIPDRFPSTYADYQHYFGDMREYINKFCWVLRVSSTGT